MQDRNYGNWRMALRVLVFHIVAYIVPLTLILAVSNSSSRPAFGVYGTSVTWDLLRLLIVIIAASGGFMLWKFVIQPELNKFRFNPSQNRKTVERLMRRYPKFHDTSKANFSWIQDIEKHAPEIINEIKEFRKDDAADQLFQTAYQNDILSLSPTWTTLNLISYGSINSHDLPRTLEILNQAPNIFNCNVSRMVPRSELKQHAGESTCYIRCQLGLQIPAEAPTTAIHVSDETRSWKEGEVRRNYQPVRAGNPR